MEIILKCMRHSTMRQCRNVRVRVMRECLVVWVRSKCILIFLNEVFNLPGPVDNTAAAILRVR